MTPGSAVLPLFFSPMREGDDVTPRSGDRADSDRSLILDASEAALLERIAAHDVAAFDEVYLAYFDGLAAFVYRIVGTADVARDVVQDTFLGLWNGDVRRITVSLRAYLYGTARYRALHVARRSAVERRAAERPDVRDPEAWHGQAAEAPDIAAERATLDDEVEALIRGLSDRQRMAVELRWADGLTATEIGVVMGISEAAVRKLLRHAEVRLSVLRDRWGSTS